jgi:hypothetical protein
MPMPSRLTVTLFSALFTYAALMTHIASEEGKVRDHAIEMTQKHVTYLVKQPRMCTTEYELKVNP